MSEEKIYYANSFEIGRNDIETFVRFTIDGLKSIPVTIILPTVIAKKLAVAFEEQKKPID